MKRRKIFQSILSKNNRWEKAGNSAVEHAYVAALKAAGDFTNELGKKKIEKERLENVIQLQKGDSEAINYPSDSFDAVMVAFGVRNFENLEKGLSEMLRVTKPGGQLVILEFSKPRWRAMRSLYSLYMGIVAPQVARWFRQNKEAYKYLCESANAFPERRQFVDILKKLGYCDTGYKPLSLGICCIYSGRKSL